MGVIMHQDSRYTGDSSGGGASSFSDLSDVQLSNLQNGQVPVYDSTAGKWKNANSPSGSEIDDTTTASNKTWSSQKINLEISQLSGSLAGLDDVALSTPTDGQVLAYDDTSDEWVNADIPSEIDDSTTGSASTWSSTKIQLELSQLSGSLVGLTDVAVSSLSDGQALVYDANDNKWENKDIEVDVDQTYDGTSTNPQSGTAVAEAISDKADLVSSATSGNFAGLDSNGNLTDSGVASDIVPSTATSSNKLATLDDLPEELNDLDDVVITSPVNAQIMAYNATSGKWENKTGQEVLGGVVFKGSIFFANIPTTGMVNGDGYNIKDAFTTDSRFIEGSGIECLAGTDIAWVESESKWNILTPSGVHSFNGRTGAVVPAANDYSASDVGLGNVVNTGDSDTPVSGGTTKFTTGGAYTELNKKADKVTSATNGNFAGLDANGNLTDSGSSASDFATVDGHTILPDPNGSTTPNENSVVSAVNNATATSDEIPSLYGVQKWSNEQTKRFIIAGAASNSLIHNTGVGIWDEDADLIEAHPAGSENPASLGWYELDTINHIYVLTEDTTVVSEKTYFDTVPDESSWVYVELLTTIDATSSDDIFVSLKYDPATKEEIILGGYLIDTNTGRICIRFGNYILDTVHARVAVDINYTRNQYSVIS